MSVQRTRRAHAIQYWQSGTTVNLRGDTVVVPDEGPFNAKAWIIPQRSSRAEVPGQREIFVIRIGINPDIEGVDQWTKVSFNDQEYDVASPPGHHYGTRHTEHITLDLRRRGVTRGDHG